MLLCRIQKQIDDQRTALAQTLDELGESPPQTERRPREDGLTSEGKGGLLPLPSITGSGGKLALPALPPIHRSRSGNAPEPAEETGCSNFYMNALLFK